MKERKGRRKEVDDDGDDDMMKMKLQMSLKNQEYLTISDLSQESMLCHCLTKGISMQFYNGDVAWCLGLHSREDELSLLIPDYYL